jgi:hypothetical protein
MRGLITSGLVIISTLVGGSSYARTDLQSQNSPEQYNFCRYECDRNYYYAVLQCEEDAKRYGDASLWACKYDAQTTYLQCHDGCQSLYGGQ